ncbi:MAG: hypothetical protein JXB85_11405 [Anaerolineales bacterium]|nr:hypothetical protein [Anaerolineales bacterium]
MFRKFLPVLLILALSTVACGFSISVPNSVTPGPEVTEEIDIPVPEEAESVDLTLEFGAGQLQIVPGGEGLLSGTVTYNVDLFQPEVHVRGDNVRLEQRGLENELNLNWNDVVNHWDLVLGRIPMSLAIQAGAYKAEYELGGLALENLTVQDGAAEVELSFSEPNRTEMQLLRYETGASSVTLRGLANANFDTMEFDGGAGNFTLDFSGELRRDATVTIETGISNMTLVIPDDVHVVLTVESGLSNVTIGSGWTQNNNTYTQPGDGPTLTIIIEIGAGNLTVTH